VANIAWIFFGTFIGFVGVLFFGLTSYVTLKIRKGWNNDNIVACEIAQIAEKNGISAITIHGRTRDEFYGGKVDLEIIKKVKKTSNYFRDNEELMLK